MQSYVKFLKNTKTKATATWTAAFAHLYYYGLFYFVSARQSISFNCVMFMFATEEIKIDSMPSGR